MWNYVERLITRERMKKRKKDNEVKSRKGGELGKVSTCK